MELAEDELDRIAHIALPVGDAILMGTDNIGEGLSGGNNFVIRVEPDSGEEAERVFAAFAEEGEVMMDLHEEPWAEKHGSCRDQFGVHWMIDYGGDAVA